jgi:hypothetical protein
VPQYESLTIAIIMEKIQRTPEVLAYLPCMKEIEKLPKAWLCNTIYSVVGKDFLEWVEDCISKRNEKVTVAKDIMINVAPDILKAFESSNAVSL